MIDTNFQKNKEEIAKKIKEKAINLKCPVCDNQNMILGEGYFAHDLQNDLNSRTMGGKNIPTIPIICSNCGYMREFAAGVLKLLPTADNIDSTKQAIGN